MTDDDGQPITPDGDGQPIDGTREITGFVTYAGEGFAVVRPKPETGEHPVPTPGIESPLPARRTAGALPRRRLHDALRRRARARAGPGREPSRHAAGALRSRARTGRHPRPVDRMARPRATTRPSPRRSCASSCGRAAELGRLRGTHAGVELALKLNFPDLPCGSRTAAASFGPPRPRCPTPSPPAFVVYCDTPISKDEAATIVRVIEAVKPAHVAFRLRVKGPRRSAAES